MAEQWFNDQGTVQDTADFRRMVQTCLDVGVVDTAQSGQVDGNETGVALLPPIMERPDPPEEDDDNG